MMFCHKLIKIFGTNIKVLISRVVDRFALFIKRLVKLTLEESRILLVLCRSYDMGMLKNQIGDGK